MQRISGILVSKLRLAKPGRGEISDGHLEVTHETRALCAQAERELGEIAAGEAGSRRIHRDAYQKQFKKQKKEKHAAGQYEGDGKMQRY